MEMRFFFPTKISRKIIGFAQPTRRDGMSVEKQIVLPKEGMYQKPSPVGCASLTSVMKIQP
jgi:hypothetical protein